MMDELLARIDALIAEPPEPESVCGIEGHDCRVPMMCFVAGLLAAEAASDDAYSWGDAMHWSPL